jgi:hypothetical protein
MLSRRRFLSPIAAGAAVASVPELLAAHDLLIKGGRVMDPSRKFDQAADVAIAERENRRRAAEHRGVGGGPTPSTRPESSSFRV